ncbi:MAG: hypothetical protein ACREDM_03300 [Methylocella sp.]
MKIINAARLMSLVLLAFYWQAGVTAATNDQNSDALVDTDGNLRVPADYRTAYQSARGHMRFAPTQKGGLNAAV